MAARVRTALLACLGATAVHAAAAAAAAAADAPGNSGSRLAPTAAALQPLAPRAADTGAAAPARLVIPAWNDTRITEAFSSACVVGSKNWSNNTRWTHFALPAGAPPRDGFPVYIQVSIRTRILG